MTAITRRGALIGAGAAAVAVVGVPGAVQGDPVEPLLAMECRMNAVEAVLDAPDGLDSPLSVHREWWAIQDQIAELPAISVAGIAVKLRLMRANTEYLDCHEFGDKLIASTIESAERLTEEARS